MLLTFKTLALVGNHVFSPGEKGDVADETRAIHLIETGAAVAYVQPAPAPVVREAVAVEPKQARKAVSR